MDPEPKAPEAKQSPRKLLVDFGPLLIFFLCNWQFGIFVATGAFMAAVLVAMAISWFAERRVPAMTLFTAALVMVFGGLTIWLHNETFIKIKVTIIEALIGAILLFGLYTGRSFLKLLLGQALPLTDEGWRKLTLRYALFSFALAGLNEIIWRSVSGDTWVTFKVFGVLGLTLVFMMAQAPLMSRHMVEEPSADPPEPDPKQGS